MELDSNFLKGKLWRNSAPVQLKKSYCSPLENGDIETLKKEMNFNDKAQYGVKAYRFKEENV